MNLMRTLKYSRPLSCLFYSYKLDSNILFVFIESSMNINFSFSFVFNTDSLFRYQAIFWWIFHCMCKYVEDEGEKSTKNVQKVLLKPGLHLRFCLPTCLTWNSRHKEIIKTRKNCASCKDIYRFLLRFYWTLCILLLF